jgi:hypothetical protein
MDSPIMMLCKVDFFMNQYGRKSELLYNFFMKLSSTEFYENLSGNLGPDTRSQID